MSIREVPSQMTSEMVKAFIKGFYDNEGHKYVREKIGNVAVRANAMRGFAWMLKAAPAQKRPRVDNIPGNAFMRNLRKFRIEGKYMAVEMKPHLERWLKRPWSAHDFTNIFVEAGRLSPYIIGHVNVVIYPAFCVLALFVLLT